MMRLSRAIRHLSFPHWRVRRYFDAATLKSIASAIGEGERSHAGQVRFAIEGALPASYLLRDAPTRQRALMVFSKLHVWDTEHNTGVLIYVNLADRRVEVVADRGVAHVVGSHAWQSVCRAMESAFAARRWRDGAIDGVRAVSAALAVAVPPPSGGTPNELSDRPVIL